MEFEIKLSSNDNDIKAEAKARREIKEEKKNKENLIPFLSLSLFGNSYTYCIQHREKEQRPSYIILCLVCCALFGYSVYTTIDWIVLVGTRKIPCVDFVEEEFQMKVA